MANMTYFVGLSVMPLALAAALFFVAPLLITLLSIPFLGEKVGGHRWAAVFVGFAGVLVMLIPELTGQGLGVPLWTYALPLLAALTYAGSQILTRKLGLSTSASALAIYIQSTFLLVSISFFIVAGDGRFAEGLDNPSLHFLLRAWTFPPLRDWWVFGLIGLLIAGVTYTLSQAYRMGEAGVVAPFEYIALPLAVLWGWSVFGEVPGPFVWAGIALVLGSGLYVVWRERISAKRD
jgi:S-adenosylmethionine uptake transporter